MPPLFQIGIIGAGMIGDVLLERVRTDGRGEVRWIASRSDETLRKKMQKYGVPHGTTDYRDMLADAALDAVIIASPPFTHLGMLEAALKAGKAVLLEKPMVISRDELNRLAELRKRYPDPLILECSCRHARLQPKFRAVRQLIREGRLGDVYHIHHTHLTRSTFIEYNPAGAWAHRKDQAGGGPFLDQGVYDLSFHLGVLGDVPGLKTLDAFTRRGLKRFEPGFRSDTEEHGAAWMAFDTGLTYYYERGSGAHMESANETRIMGTRGGLVLQFNTWDSPEIAFFTFDDSGREATRIIVPDGLDGHDDNLALVAHFLDCLEGRAEPAMTVELAARHLDILFRILG